MSDPKDDEDRAAYDAAALEICNVVYGMLATCEATEGNGINGLCLAILRIAQRSTDQRVIEGAPALLREIAGRIDGTYIPESKPPAVLH